VESRGIKDITQSQSLVSLRRNRTWRHTIVIWAYKLEITGNITTTAVKGKKGMMNS
jgi:hypothetical protein